MDWQLSIASPCFRGICQVLFRTRPAHHARIPKNLAEMSQLERTYPEIWSEISNGNGVVNKNTTLFCALGPDQVLDQLIKSTDG